MIKLKKQDLRKRLLHIGKTVECGLVHSNIPECCVRYYVVRMLTQTQKEKKSYWKLIDRAAASAGRYPGYIPCPQCLKKKKFIKIVGKCPTSHCNHFDEQAGS